jgi:hypothetical protein
VTLVLFVIVLGVSSITTNPSVNLMEKLAELKFPLDQHNLKLALTAGLVTNQPELDKKSPFVVTPFGVFARECVLGVAPNSRVTELDSGDLLVENRVNSSFWVYESQSKYKCRERFEPKNLATGKRSKVNLNVSAPLWQDGWLDNAWDSDNNVEFGYYSSSYTVPGTPPDGSAILFWFLGLESSNSDLSILQPVLTWNNIVSGWSFASWYCCPSGTPNYATPIQGFGPGSTLYGEMRADNPTSGSDFIVSSCSTTSDCSVLASPAQGRTFIVADITLETYHITDCSMFAPGPMTFSNIVMKDISGNALTPGWYDVSGPTECSGQLTIQNAQTVVITHQNS